MIEERINRPGRAQRPQIPSQGSDLLTQVQIANPEQRLSQYPHHFSGGMRQRVMFAMALACNPKLIPTDKPRGCVFHQRCPIAIEACKDEMPQAREARPDHWVACIRAGEVEPPALI